MTADSRHERKPDPAVESTRDSSTRENSTPGGSAPGDSTADDSLIVAVVCRDGDRFITQTLAAVEQLVAARAPAATTAILVDSASSDKTGGLMQTFADSRPWASTYTLSGNVNAAVARNTVLRVARNRGHRGAALMLDGDVTADPNFLATAMPLLERGDADVVYGMLPEVWYDANGNAYDERADRYGVGKQHYEKWFKGVVLLGNPVLQSGLEYDEGYERLEDIEFSLRVADSYRILAIPVAMGTHHTDGYHSRSRLGDFVRQQYQRPVGQLFRQYWNRPSKLLTVRRSYIGYAIGLVMMALLTGGVVAYLVTGSSVLFALAVGIIVYDFSRFFRQERGHEFLPLRVIGGLQILTGLVLPARRAGPYEVTPPV